MKRRTIEGAPQRGGGPQSKLG